MIINLNALLRSYIGNSITAVPCTVDLDDLLTSNDLEELNIDIDTLLAYRREVAVIWSFEDVLAVRPDLNEDQAWDVLQECQRVYDRNVGFDWSLIKDVAGRLFLQPTAVLTNHEEG